MAGGANHPLFAMGLLWPALAAEQASEFAASVAHGLVELAGVQQDDLPSPAPAWATPNEVVLDLASVRLRGFAQSMPGPPTLICAPFALHTATVTDLAPGHSLVETLSNATGGPVYVADWRSADATLGARAIDDYVADLNVLVDEFGGAVDFVGLCQGGWMGLLYAARFPGKLRRLVLAGAPIDIAAANSTLSRLAQSTPLSVFRELVALGDGRMPGQRLLRLWDIKPLSSEEIQSTLQIADAVGSDAFRRIEARFREWHTATMDLPGRYYLEVIERIYLKNELATGRFAVLGKTVDFTTVTNPIFVLAGRDDEVVASAQALAVQRLVGTPANAMRSALAPCRHLGLFMGRKTLAHEWREVGRWLAAPDTAAASRPQRGGESGAAGADPAPDAVERKSRMQDQAAAARAPGPP